MASEKHLGPQRQARARRSPGMFSHRLDGKRARPQKGDHGHPDVFGPRDPGRCDLIGRRPLGSLGVGGRWPGVPGSLWVLRGRRETDSPATMTQTRRWSGHALEKQSLAVVAPGPPTPPRPRRPRRAHRSTSSARCLRSSARRRPSPGCRRTGAPGRGERADRRHRRAPGAPHRRRPAPGTGWPGPGPGPPAACRAPETPQNKGRSTGRQFEPGVYPRGGPREGRGARIKPITAHPTANAPDAAFAYGPRDITTDPAKPSVAA